MARLGGFEPPTDGLEVRCSVQLSYRRLFIFFNSLPICVIIIRSLGQRYGQHFVFGHQSKPYKLPMAPVKVLFRGGHIVNVHPVK